jgi:hypothetical protein
MNSPVPQKTGPPFIGFDGFTCFVKCDVWPDQCDAVEMNGIPSSFRNPPHETKKYLFDSAEACDLIHAFTSGKTLADYQKDPLLLSGASTSSGR